MDRLILELKLPPSDAYFKLRHTIEEVNALIAANAGGAEVPVLSPTAGNVAFSAGLYGWSFTLQSFAQLYSDVCGGGFDPRCGRACCLPLQCAALHRCGAAKPLPAPAALRATGLSRAATARAALPLTPPRRPPTAPRRDFAQRLWGDVYFDDSTRGFRRKAPSVGAARTFVTFILDPLYKVYSQVGWAGAGGKGQGTRGGCAGRCASTAAGSAWGASNLPSPHPHPFTPLHPHPHPPGGGRAQQVHRAHGGRVWRVPAQQQLRAGREAAAQGRVHHHLWQRHRWARAGVWSGGVWRGVEGCWERLGAGGSDGGSS